jgi:hypothetical protein
VSSLPQWHGHSLGWASASGVGGGWRACRAVEPPGTSCGGAALLLPLLQLPPGRGPAWLVGRAQRCCRRVRSLGGQRGCASKLPQQRVLAPLACTCKLTLRHRRAPSRGRAGAPSAERCGPSGTSDLPQRRRELTRSSEADARQGARCGQETTSFFPVVIFSFLRALGQESTLFLLQETGFYVLLTLSSFISCHILTFINTFTCRFFSFFRPLAPATRLAPRRRRAASAGSPCPGHSRFCRRRICASRVVLSPFLPSLTLLVPR